MEQAFYLKDLSGAGDNKIIFGVEALINFAKELEEEDLKDTIFNIRTACFSLTYSQSYSVVELEKISNNVFTHVTE